MLSDVSQDSRHQSICVLAYEEATHRLRATWSGYVDPVEAIQEARTYLQHAAHTPCARLLDDHRQLRGPWFDSLDWLAEVWVPQATRLGLRYVAHVVQADRHSNVIPHCLPAAVPFELQVFQDVDDAQHWLRQCE